MSEPLIKNVSDTPYWIAHRRGGSACLAHVRLVRGREPPALDSWQHVANNVRGGVGEDAGHCIPEEKPERATREILKFLGEL